MRVVAPGRKELGGNLILGVPNNFPDEVELTLRDLVPDGRDVEKSHPEGGVRDAMLNYLCDGDFEDLPHISVEKNL